MTRRLLPLLVVLAWAAPARAGGDVGVIVAGDNTMQPQVLALVQGWLQSHGHQLVASPMPPEGMNKLIDCFVIEDTSCARKAVETQAKTSTLVFARVEVADNAASGMRDVTITAYWFERGSDPVAEKRSCEKCTDATLRTTGDELMSALAGSGRKTVGRLQVTSTPAGAHITIDGAAAGVTPLAVAVTPGAHQIIVTADGMRDEQRTVTIVQGQTAPVVIAMRPPSTHTPHARLPLAIIGIGGALALTGVIVYATSDTDTGAAYQYRDTQPLGIGLAVGGLAIAGVGVYMWITGKPHADSAPVAAVLPGGAYLGWGKAF